MTTADRSIATPISLLPPRKSVLSRFLRWEWFLVLLIVLVVIANSQLSPYFLDVRNLFRASSDFLEIGLMMLPMVLIIVTGNVDLAVASTLGMTASFMGLLFNNGLNIWIAAGAALGLGTLAGLLNGYLISRLKVPALVITLGTYAFYRGLAYVMLGDQAARGYPESFTYLGQGTLPGTPIPFALVIFLLLAVVFGLVLHKTAFGRYLYAIGSNQDAVIYSGISVPRVKIIIFMVSGLMAALAGLVLAARYGSTRPDIGTGLELAVITAVVLGGVDINGGKGTMIGAILALLLVGLDALWHGPVEHSRPGAEHRHWHPVDPVDLAAKPATDYSGAARQLESPHTDRDCGGRRHRDRVWLVLLLVARCRDFVVIRQPAIERLNRSRRWRQSRNPTSPPSIHIDRSSSRTHQSNKEQEHEDSTWYDPDDCRVIDQPAAQRVRYAGHTGTGADAARATRSAGSTHWRRQDLRAGSQEPGQSVF